MTEPQLILGLQRDDRLAQRTLFDRYAPRMFAVCKRYVKQREDAEDVMIEGIYKAIANIEKFRGDGSFEGWLRRIVVNECLMFLRKQNNFGLTAELDDRFHQIQDTDINIADALAGQDILALLDKLPTGYRTVFNLYVIEGFKHREIAETLNISINTSKSQLILAKDKLRQMLASESFRRAV